MSQRSLHISEDLSLPLNAVTSTVVVYGGKGMGKTNFGGVVVEELSKTGLRFSVLDPMGVWWGIRHSADGKGPGVECLILGGAHGDIPIEPTGGAVIADLVVDNRVNVIIDISRKANGEMWSIGERIRFATDYGRQLFKRQGSLVDGKRREPICQLIDEAARFIPQMVRSGDVDVAKCVGVWSAIVEEGRNVGLGVVLLTQRSARLNKDVAELADLMLAFRTVGPHSMEAVMDWLGAHVPKDQLRTLSGELRALPVGSALAVSPGWLNVEKVIRIRRRETFDSSATPKPGEQAVRVKGEGARPDLAVYVERMKETIERAKADDPKELKRRIAELERAAARPAAAPLVAGLTKEEQETIAMLKDELEKLAKTAQQMESDYARAFSALKRARDISQQLFEALNEVDLIGGDSEAARSIREGTLAARSKLQPIAAKAAAVSPAISQKRDVPLRPRAIAASSGPGEKMGKALRSILNVLAQHGPSTRNKVAAIAGYSASGGGFSNAISEGRTKGWLSGSDPVAITDAGTEALGHFDPLPSGAELLQSWLNRLGKAERSIVEALAAAHPRELTKHQLGEATGYAADGGGFTNAISRLRTLELIEGRGELRLHKDFAEAIGG